MCSRLSPYADQNTHLQTKEAGDAVDVGDENEEDSDVDEEQTDEGENGSDDAVDEGAGGEENGLPARFSRSP